MGRTALFGRAQKALIRATEHVARGEWDRRSMLNLEARALVSALAEPGIVYSRLRSGPIKKSCPVLRTIFTDNRQVPLDLDAWLDAVRKTHPVQDPSRL